MKTEVLDNYYKQHPRGNCIGDHPGTPSLYDRLLHALKQEFPEWNIPPEDEDYIFDSISIPVEYLRKHISISCMECEFCHDEELYYLEGNPIYAQAHWKLFIINKSEDWGTKIHVYTIGRSRFDEDNDPPSIFDGGRIIEMEKKP